MSADTTTVRNWIRNPFTMVAAVLVAVAVVGLALWLSPPRDDAAGLPASIESTTRVGGYCAVTVTNSRGEVWALAPGSRSGELRRVGAADAHRDAPECTEVALRPARTATAMPCEAGKPCPDGGVPARPR